MGPFEWLASRWTPEFEYRDRLADEVEDIAFESTRTGTRRGFLFGILVGAIVAVIGVGALASNGIRIPFLPAAASREGGPDSTAPQPAAEELSILRYENEQLRKELATVKAATPAAREKRMTESKPPRPRAEAPAELPPREKRMAEPKPPEPKVEGASAPPREKQAGEAAAAPVKVEAPSSGPVKAAPRETAVKSDEKKKAPDNLAAKPIPSNCRSEGDCDPVGP
ncbi:MAG: hypothetical protein EHM71_00595 [Zetaproteobacteria bacterium]|nr:MAG: hypothetical protein EHM71_00595 [Zetaproteobacteria bacterium]